MISLLLRIVILLILSLSIYLLYEIRESKVIDDYWKEWEEQSFEFKGGRYDKDLFEIVDGKIALKDDTVSK